MNSQILSDTATYYDEKLRTFGATARGVDWSTQESQHLRFEQLIRLLPKKSSFSVNDLGCGYGALLHFLKSAHVHLRRYRGYDVSPSMIAQAKKLSLRPFTGGFHRIAQAKAMHMADYTLASGIFNVKMHYSNTQWKRYILGTLQMMNARSRQGFAFNALTLYSDPPKQRADLFYADPCWLFDYCKRTFSSRVALLHDYPLYEFTLFVRKVPG